MTQKTQIKWTPNEVETLRLLGGACLPHELQHFLPRHSQNGIMRKRKRLGIELADNYFERVGEYASGFRDNDNLCHGDQSISLDSLPDDVIQILLGSILGDGCIKLNGARGCQRNYVFYEGHHSAQTEYVAWKCSRLSMLNAKFSNSIVGNKPEMWTTSYSMFTELRHKIYGYGAVANKAYIPIDVFSKLDLFGLFIWYLDDGYLGYAKNSREKNHAPSIAAKGWNYDGLSKLIEFINSQFSLSLYVYVSKHRGEQNKNIKFTARDKREVFPVWQDLFREHQIPSCMAYKLELSV